MRAIPYFLLLGLGFASPAASLTLDLPVRRADREGLVAPCYRGDRFELRLAPAAARAAIAARRSRSGVAADKPLASLGVPALDRLALDLGGVAFEPEFRGEQPPTAGGTDFTAFYYAALPLELPLERALERFRALGDVVAADPIAVLPVDSVPNDSLWSISYWYYQPSRQDTHAPEAWDVTTGDTSIVVAIVDTGVIPYHPDLAGSIAGQHGNMWINRAELGGAPGVDDDGNGFVDDVSGWDFVALPSASGVVAGEDWRDQDNDPNDFAGHGTYVAGLVGALTDNTIGVAGMARNVRIMPLRIGWSSNSFPLGSVDMSFAAQAIRYATRMGANVINCSFSSLDMNGLGAAVDAAVKAGITIVSAAGNNGGPHYLGDREDGIAVGATNNFDVVPGFSNLYSTVDLVAPGVAIYSTFLARPGSDSLGKRVPAYTPFNAPLSGTSFAAPLVSGAVALIQSHRIEQSKPLLIPMGALLRVRETADDISAENPGLTGYGTGRLNVARALTDPPTSTATRGAAQTLGPGVVLDVLGGPARFALVTTDRRLLIMGGVEGDTLVNVALPGTPGGQLAAADMGGGHGVGLFVGTTNAKIAGFDVHGNPLPGWPVSAAVSLGGFRAGPALGDLDGDGVLEIVCGADDGNLWAWHLDGSVVPGFPILLDPSGLTAPPALSPIDTLPGVEIVVATNNGTLHVIRGDGGEVAGWPVTVGSLGMAPVVAKLSSSAAPSIVFAAAGALHVFAPDGSRRFNAILLPGSAAQDPALADFEGDGVDEIVLATSNNNTIDAYGSSGVELAGRFFPSMLSTPAQGPLVIGHLRAGGATGILFYAGGLMALGDSVQVLANFPKPGRAGLDPSLADLDGDGATEVVAGSGPDSVIYVYDAGPGTWRSAPQSWPTPRGNYARTGSRLYSPGLLALDLAPPSRITDLAASGVLSTALTLRWTAPADNAPIGRAAVYELRRSLTPLTEQNFSSGALLPGLPTPAAAGSPESLSVTGLQEGILYYFAVRSRDAALNESPISNLVSVTTLALSPGRVNDLRVVSRGDTSIALRWTASGDNGYVGRPVYYEIHAATTPLDSASFTAAPIQLIVLASVDAGGTETTIVPGLTRATHYWFALKARDSANLFSPLSNVLDTRTGVGGPIGSRIGIAIASAAEPTGLPVRLFWQGASEGLGRAQVIRIYDLTGRKLHVIPVGTAAGGEVYWDGRDDFGRVVPAGLYFARLASGPFHAQTRIALLR